MAILDILHFPDPRLRTKAKPVAVVDDAVRRLIDDMFETMYEAPGIGLAAIQVNVPQRVIVVDISEDRSTPLALVNPEILTKEGVEEMDEGCLSVPGIYDKVQRAERIRFRALDRNGEPLERDAEVCWPYVSSTRSITSMASCSSTTCPISSGSASARNSRRSSASG
ncbi:MAG: peptide deformylase [Pseudomonadota bacterium]